jgi:hypothetical protein
MKLRNADALRRNWPSFSAKLCVSFYELLAALRWAELTVKIGLQVDLSKWRIDFWRQRQVKLTGLDIAVIEVIEILRDTNWLVMGASYTNSGELIVWGVLAPRWRAAGC